MPVESTLAQPPVHPLASTLATPSADHALGLVLRTCFRPGIHRLALTPPAGGPFEPFLERYGLHRARVPLTGPDRNRLDVGQLLRLPVKGILLTDPVDPAGTRLDAAGLDRLLLLFPGLVVLAEADPALLPRPNLLLLRGPVVHATPPLITALRAAL